MICGFPAPTSTGVSHDQFQEWTLRHSIQCGYDGSLPPEIRGCGHTPIFDPTQYVMTQQEFINAHTAELSLQGAASLARRYAVGSHLGTFEMGFKLRNSDKTNFSNNPYYNPQSNFALSQVLGAYTTQTTTITRTNLARFSNYDKTRQPDQLQFQRIRVRFRHDSFE